MPITTVFFLASILVVALCRGIPFGERLDVFSHGAGQRDIMLMVWIFVLAGAFASVAQAMGAIEACCSLVLGIMPAGWVLPGLFFAACFVSMSIGTSVGTIASLVPIAVALSPEHGKAVFTAAIVGGAFFGDNLSFISDTTIMATRTQGIEMREKFLANIWFALPAAVVTFIIYMCVPSEVAALPTAGIDIRTLALALPYFVVIIAALCGVGVTNVLVVGLLLATGIGLCFGSIDLSAVWQAIAKGIAGMADLILVTMMAGGIVALLRRAYGLRRVKFAPRRLGLRTAQLAIAAMVSLVCMAAANNTVAILTVGEASRSIAALNSIPPRRVASILDTFSCITQSFIPWGAQILIAAGLAHIVPSVVIPHLYYPMALLAFSVLGIVCFNPRQKK